MRCTPDEVPARSSAGSPVSTPCTVRPGRPGALLCPAPLRTGRARFHASGSSKPVGADRLVVVRREAASLGPFTAQAASNTSSGSDSSSTSSWDSPDPRQRPFGSGHQARYPAGYPGRPAEEPAITVPVSRCLSVSALCFSGHPVPARGLGLPHGRLTGRLLVPGPGRGFHVPHPRDTTGLGALSTPGTAVLAPAGCRALPAPAASQRPVPAPAATSHRRGSVLRGINEGSRDSPVRPAPGL
jgi:hypothetical protein